jgi:hypothetical protein
VPITQIGPDVAVEQFRGQDLRVVHGARPGERKPEERPEGPEPQHHVTEEGHLRYPDERPFLGRWPVIVGFRVGEDEPIDPFGVLGGKQLG